MRILVLISALFLASCGVDPASSSSTDVSISFGENNIATGGIRATGDIPTNIQSVSVVALNAAGNVIAGPIIANSPNFTLRIRVPNGNNIRFRILAFAASNATGTILYETLSAPVNLQGKPVSIPVKMSLSIKVAANKVSTFRGGLVNLVGKVSGNTPDTSSPLIWAKTGGVFTVTDTYGATRTWQAPNTLGDYNIAAHIDPTVNPDQDPNVKGSVKVSVINQDPYVQTSNTSPIVIVAGSAGTTKPLAVIGDLDGDFLHATLSANKPSWVTLIATNDNPITLELQLDSTNAVPGTYTFTVGVTDDFGGELLTDVTIQVLDAPLGGPTFISSTNANNAPCNATWTAVGSPYIIQSDVFIGAGCILQIDAGTTVKFDAGLGISVDGTLDVYGTIPAPVLFTSNQAVPAAGNWSQIAYAAGSLGTIQNATIQYAGGPGSNTTPLTNDNALYIASDVSLDAVTIADSSTQGLSIAAGIFSIQNITVQNTGGKGIFIDSPFAIATNPTFLGVNKITGVDINSSSIFVAGATTNATISGFTTDGGNRGLTITNNAKATVTNNAFYGAQSDGIALSVTNPAGAVVLEDNVISRNSGYGIRVKRAANLIAQGNIVRDNYSGGIIAEVTQLQPISIYNNLIVKNNGSGVTIDTISPVGMYSNTIANNIPSLPTGGGVSLIPTANVTMVNNIFAANSIDIINPPIDVYTAGAAGLTENNNLTTDGSLLGAATGITFNNGWYSASGLDAGAGVITDYPFLSSNPYADSVNPDASLSQVDIGCHQKNPASTIFGASIVSTITLSPTPPTNPYSTVRVVFKVTDSALSTVLQPLDLYPILLYTSFDSNGPLFTGIHQVGQGLYACDILITTPPINAGPYNLLLPVGDSPNLFAVPFVFLSVDYIIP